MLRLRFSRWFRIVPHPHSYAIPAYYNDYSLPNSGRVGVGSGFWGCLISRVGKVKRFPPQDCAKWEFEGFKMVWGRSPSAFPEPGKEGDFKVV